MKDLQKNFTVSSPQLKTMFFMLLMAAAVPAFAQQAIVTPEMENLAKSVLDIFTGTIVQVVLICCLCGCAVAYGFNKDNEKMKRNVIAVGVAIIILIAARGIVGAVWKAGGGTGFQFN